MKKLKFQGGLTKLICSELAGYNRKRFCSILLREPNLSKLGRSITKQTDLTVELASYSSKQDFPEQVLSILSFLRHVGTPISWTVYSDGSHGEQQIELLRHTFSFVSVVQHPWEDKALMKKLIKKEFNSYSTSLLDFYQQHPLGKKLFCIMHHTYERPGIFLDADVLFYPQASDLEELFQQNLPGWYLPDVVWGCLDPSYLAEAKREELQVNSGFIILNKTLDHAESGLRFLASLNGRYHYFTEQTVIHILLKGNGFAPLDQERFILNSADQFDFSYLQAREKMAIRHYTGPVRHKMWQRDWHWHLSL